MKHRTVPQSHSDIALHTVPPSHSDFAHHTVPPTHSDFAHHTVPSLNSDFTHHTVPTFHSAFAHHTVPPSHSDIASDTVPPSHSDSAHIIRCDNYIIDPFIQHSILQAFTETHEWSQQFIVEDFGKLVVLSSASVKHSPTTPDNAQNQPCTYPDRSVYRFDSTKFKGKEYFDSLVLMIHNSLRGAKFSFV